MSFLGKISSKSSIESFGIKNSTNQYCNLSSDELVKESLSRNMGSLSNTGALCIRTGEFTGRSPEDKFTVDNEITHDSVDWNKFNKPFPQDKFDALFNKVCHYFEGKEVFIQDSYACADPRYRIRVRIFAEYPWSAQFAGNMFIRLTEDQIENFDPEWCIYCAPGFRADPSVDGTRQHNFSMIDFKSKRILIGGSAYTGEIKKSIFTILNFVLPYQKQVLSMHCSANIGKQGDTTIFFGLSGTGKTTLSADPERGLIGDDEHGWSDTGIFNFEGGCYAKCIDLTEEKEPDIFNAIKTEAILENIGFQEASNIPDYSDSSITENTRVSYPIEHIRNAVIPSIGGHPRNIFFLTCDAYGILPPISKLTTGQAMYHFISGYTAKVAGTEAGITEPKATFSSCFGAPFLPLHPTFYASMLGKKIDEFKPNIWLVNTGWTAGPYGIGSRIKLSFTRALITAAMNGNLDLVNYQVHEIFGLKFPTSCPEVPSEILNPKNTWQDPEAYDQKANALAELFIHNFEKFKSKADAEMLAAAPKLLVG
ncbi:MAG: phosphoenolpyruvate carboxykinase (ATP) [Saprospiraceae bacterium]|nr:phosphoenolpyruvate carboxykinase (ATP) [Saprospiraceae bacterium]MBK9222627.1 phosphoenolpyruvate carboxykinase (ATP) [Saprospiraceae bacterium]